MKRSRLPRLVGALLMLAAAAVPATGAADPGEDHDHGSVHSGPPELAPFAGPAFEDMTLVGNSDKDGTTNSDLAFWGDLAFAGNYGGFRILDISEPAQPQVLVDYVCRGPQNDVSVHRAGNRLLLFQSVDRPQTKESCDGTPAGSSQDTPASSTFPGQATFGFEGIRIFDVTDPSRPAFLDGVPTACGSHTHTLVPEDRGGRLHLYVSSYPLGNNITPADTPVGAGPRCASPHKKISIVTIPFEDPLGWTVREKALSDDTAPFPGASGGLSPAFQGCHDIQVLLKDHVAVASCVGDAQIWDISDPANPTSANGEAHTHIAAPSAADAFEFIHSGVITWDGAYLAVMDETGGGNTAECDGSAPELGGASEHGFYYFYPRVTPGAPAPALVSRYMIPRPQGTQVCVPHNANMLPVKDRYIMSSAFYQGGNSLVDFTNVTNPTEVAYSDPEDVTGLADSWSAYWYNDFVYVNGGLNRRGATANRGLDVFSVQQGGQPLTTRTWHHSNPQTQETLTVRPAVFRPSTGTWYVHGDSAVAWGTGGDVPVAGDYDGDGDDDPAVFRPSTAVWYPRGGPAGAFGTSGDVPVPADYDGDGDTDTAVFRPSTGIWYVRGGPTVAFGTSGDVPVPADYDGDGDGDVAVFRPSTGTWYVQGITQVAFGTSGDVPVPADYDGDGAAEVAVFRPSTGIWYVHDGAAAQFGTSGDVAAPGDYDGEPGDEMAVFRPAQGVWYVRGGNPPATPWGTQGDLAIRLLRP